MKILVIPELREKEITDLEMSRIEENLYKTIEDISVANLASWSAIAPPLEELQEDDTLNLLIRGYFALGLNPLFLRFDVYIGFLFREDVEKVDAIIFTSEAAKAIYEMRLDTELLPKAKETIVISGEMSVENEIYKRTSKYNKRNGR